ncbi:MAG TPA: hypothetical protein VE913_12050 [Longimicrobium sp.]|nr:hypothetical protein [Longimicrobium sp.]
MSRKITALIACGLMATAACSESSAGPQATEADLAAAFTSSITGYDAGVSSFAADSTEGFGPGQHGGRGRDRHGPGGLPGDVDFMGGGFMDDYRGGSRAGGRPFDGRGRSESCAFAAATGQVTCTSTHRGLAVVRTLAYRTAAGATQSAPDSTTDVVTTRVQVSGTTQRRDSVTSVVSHTHDRVVTGLARGSTRRTVNGTSAGTENSSGTSDRGAFTALRTMGDTTRALVVPVQNGRPSYPTAGTVIRAMRVTVTYAGATPTTSTRREVVTYDGSATARLVITRDGTTRNCTLPLPHGRPNCQ